MDNICFDSRNPIYKSPFGALKSGEKVAFSISLPQDCGVWYAYLLLRRDEEAEDKVLTKAVHG